jgi:hypothetical protein
MKTNTRWRPYGRAVALAATCVAIGGCAVTRQELVNRGGPLPPAAATTAASHCSGTETMDNSMIAVFPMPILAFASPTQEVNEITADDVLRRCGPSDRLANTRVEVDRGWCVPTVVTRLLTLGIWHWCPATVSWDADVTAPPARTTAEAAPPAPTGGQTASAPRRLLESSEY